MSTVFISDIHLGGEHPEISERFITFLQSKVALEAEAFYILGDLFEVWIGDDGAQEEHQGSIAALKQLTASTPTYVMHGNRDFLLGPGFEAMTGCQLISEPTVINLYGVPTLLLHGDSLCTDDQEYQRFRQQMRSPQWQSQFLALPLSQRADFAQQARQQSSQRNQEKSMAIMDVNQQAVEKILKAHGVTQMIHGHTHRPDTHQFELHGAQATRVVLGDWYEQQSSLIASIDGLLLN